MQDDLAVLRKVRDRVRTGWTRGAGARNHINIPVDCTDRSATSWCLIGAIYREMADAGDASTANRLRITDAVRSCLPDLNRLHALDIWNDHVARSVDDVVGVLDLAIAKFGGSDAK